MSEIDEIDDKIFGDPIAGGFAGDDNEIELSLGQCCACYGTENVRNIVTHDFRAPVPGTGWGCELCHLPMDGAISVICDHCRDHQVAIVDVCSGFPKNNQRLALSGIVKTPFTHDLALHLGRTRPPRFVRSQ